MRSYEMTEIGHRGLAACLTEAFGHRHRRLRRRLPVRRHRRLRPRARAGHRHPRARRADRPRAAGRRPPDLPGAAGGRASTSSRCPRPTTTPTSPPRWPTGWCSRRCRAIARRRRDARDGTTWDPALPLLADRPDDLRRTHDPAMTAHPLDPLSADEFRAAAAVLRRDKGVGERWRFAVDRAARAGQGRRPQLAARRPRPARGAGDLLEPRRRTPPTRRVVSLTDDAVLAWTPVPGEQPNMTVDEWHEATSR